MLDLAAELHGRVALRVLLLVEGYPHVERLFLLQLFEDALVHPGHADRRVSSPSADARHAQVLLGEVHLAVHEHPLRHEPVLDLFQTDLQRWLWPGHSDHSRGLVLNPGLQLLFPLFEPVQLDGAERMLLQHVLVVVRGEGFAVQSFLGLGQTVYFGH